MTKTMQKNLGSRSPVSAFRPLAVWAMLAALLVSSRARADEPPSPPPPKIVTAAAAEAPLAAPAPAAAVADKDGFVPESRPPAMKSPEEGLPAAPLVGAAYGFIWLAVFGFVVWTLRRTTQLEGEIADLRERIARAQGGAK